MNEIDAVVLAGGKGTRMGKDFTEKPLIKILGTHLIDYVLSELSKSKYIGEIFVSISPFTPNTGEHIRKRGFKVIETPGLGYVEDLKYSMQYPASLNVFICPADLPLLRTESVNKVLSVFGESKPPSFVVTIPVDVTRTLGVTSRYEMTVDGRIVVPCGVNVVNRNTVLQRECVAEKCFVTDILDFCVNVNTLENLQIAKNVLKERNRSKTKPD